VWLLLRLNERFMSTRNETILVQSENLTVEHLLPQSWVAHWPLPDGQTGISEDELAVGDETTSQAKASRLRNRVLHTIGNLTLITQPLNSAILNGPWQDKRSALLAASLLPLNLQLHTADAWDEDAIATRSATLFAQALQLWPRS
jgi:hypothetical protein